MQSSVVVSEPTPSGRKLGEHTGDAGLEAYASGREGRQFRQPRAVPSYSGRPLPKDPQVVTDACEAADDQLDDLIFSWRRLTDPKLRKLVIQIIRSMAT